MRVGSHYSCVFDIQRLIKLAESRAKQIKQISNKLSTTPVLVYSGFSGVSFATALSIALHDQELAFEQMYVRKINEESHGEPVESSGHTLGPGHYTLVFVDDFLASGSTAKYTITNSLSMFSKASVINPYVLAVLQKEESNEGLISFSLDSILTAEKFVEKSKEFQFSDQLLHPRSFKELSSVRMPICQKQMSNNMQAVFWFTHRSQEISLQFV